MNKKHKLNNIIILLFHETFSQNELILQLGGGREGGRGGGGPVAPQGHHSLLAVTEQLKVPNEHFNARLVDGGFGLGIG